MNRPARDLDGLMKVLANQLGASPLVYREFQPDVEAQEAMAQWPLLRFAESLAQKAAPMLSWEEPAYRHAQVEDEEDPDGGWGAIEDWLRPAPTEEPDTPARTRAWNAAERLVAWQAEQERPRPGKPKPSRLQAMQDAAYQPDAFRPQQLQRHQVQQAQHQPRPQPQGRTADAEPARTDSLQDVFSRLKAPTGA